ncbi:hypothetical protein ACW9HC_34510 [Nocardia gipuzkoensis]
MFSKSSSEQMIEGATAVDAVKSRSTTRPLWQQRHVSRQPVLFGRRTAPKATVLPYLLFEQEKSP